MLAGASILMAQYAGSLGGSSRGYAVETPTRKDKTDRSGPEIDAKRLIAAAPEMLAALEMMLSWHDCDGWCIEAQWPSPRPREKTG